MPSDTYNSENDNKQARTSDHSNTDQSNSISSNIENSIDNDPKVVRFEPRRNDANVDLAHADQPSVVQLRQPPTANERGNAESNVISLFTQRAIDCSQQSKIVRIFPETNGYRMLYANLDNRNRLIAIPILCWALKTNGDIVGIVPWLDEVLECQTIDQHFRVSWEGFYCASTESVFFEPPAQIAAMLTASARFIDNDGLNDHESVDASNYHIIQEIADPVGTHAMLIDADTDSLVLTSVVSWVLTDGGELRAMLANEEKIQKLPILPGDPCLYDAQRDPLFKCFFQRDIAEQIRDQNPETMEAIERLFVAE